MSLRSSTHALELLRSHIGESSTRCPTCVRPGVPRALVTPKSPGRSVATLVDENVVFDVAMDEPTSWAASQADATWLRSRTIRSTLRLECDQIAETRTPTSRIARLEPVLARPAAYTSR